jgi:deoxyribonuclease-4
LRQDAFRKDLAKIVGLSRVKVLHLNDSKKELGSRVDRHEHIGLGKLGKTGFIPLLRDPIWANIPKILETRKGSRPDGKEWDEVNLKTLQSLAKSKQKF